MAYLEKRILAVVPARGGSKGIPKKNIYPVLGKPLINYTTNIIEQCNFMDYAIISTDDKDIAKISCLDFPFLRPAELSGDRVGDYPVIKHALENVEKLTGDQFDIILMLQPTSPLRTVDDIETVLKKMILGDYDSVMTVSQTDTKGHPFKQFTISNNQIKHWDQRGKEILARQELKPTYHKNGIAYAITRECLTRQKTLFGKRHTFSIVQRDVINIDTLFDIKLLEFLLLNQ